MVPHLGFSEQLPAFKRTKHRALTAQRFHRAVADEIRAVANGILHGAPPTFVPDSI
jgi:hypothetical protein